MRWRDSFHPYAMITILFWSLAYVFTRLALEYFSPFALGFLRYMVAYVTLIAVAVIIKMKLPRKKDLIWFLFAGAVGFFLYIIAFNKGEETVTAATASVVISTVPVITALFARIIYNERPQVVQWIAITIEFAGVAVLSLSEGNFSVSGGLLWLISAAVLLSIYNLLQRKLTKNYSALQTSAFSIFFGTILLAVFLPASVNEVVKAPPVQIFYIAVLGVFSGTIAYLSWSKAFAKAKQTSQVSNYMFITPFLTTLLGFLIAGEIPEQRAMLGGGIILLGVFIFNFGGIIPEKAKSTYQKVHNRQ